MFQLCCFPQLVAQEGLTNHVHGASYTNHIRRLKFGSVGIGIIVPYIRIKPGWICVAEIVSCTILPCKLFFNLQQKPG
ncbi:hypothetical protein M758_6G212900 [Ceratodon purpureus]|nr:hypothetical protein M758_6G212900 [Ceratodon purpureus]